MRYNGRDISITGPDGSFSAYLSAPDDHRGVVVVVLQEIFGVNANIRTIADDFAAEGYVAVAPDLFWRQDHGVQLDPSSDDGRKEAMERMKKLNADEAVTDGQTALKAVRAQISGLDASAAVGYCFGGGIAYLMAARGLVDAGIAYYGTGIHNMLNEVDELPSKLLLHIAREDYLCPREAQSTIIHALAGKEDAEVVVYDGAGHAFARKGGDAFVQEVADAANAKTAAMLQSLVCK